MTTTLNPKLIGRTLLAILACTSLYLFLNPRTVTEVITETEVVPTSGELLSQKVDHINYNIIALERIKENATKKQESLRKERDAELKLLFKKGEQRDRHLNPNLYMDAQCDTISMDSCKNVNKTLMLTGRKEIYEAVNPTWFADGDCPITATGIEDCYPTNSGINIIEE